MMNKENITHGGECMYVSSYVLLMMNKGRTHSQLTQFVHEVQKTCYLNPTHFTPKLVHMEVSVFRFALKMVRKTTNARGEAYSYCPYYVLLEWATSCICCFQPFLNHLYCNSVLMRGEEDS